MFITILDVELRSYGDEKEEEEKKPINHECV